MNKILILAISVFVISSNFQAVSAEIFFPSTNVRVDGPNEYCIINPTDELVQNKSEEWTGLTKNARKMLQLNRKKWRRTNLLWKPGFIVPMAKPTISPELGSSKTVAQLSGSSITCA